MKVLRIAHHGVVSSWRERERMLRSHGTDVELVSARRWAEGGSPVHLTTEGDTFVRGAGTVGKHPNAFLYNPIPIWRALGSTPAILDLHEEPCSLATAEILALRALRRSNVPYTLYSAQNIHKSYPIPFRWFESYALKHAAGAYVCNQKAGEILSRKGLRVRPALIPLGVDLKNFHAIDRDTPSGKAIVGYVGQLEPHKGVETLIRAAAIEPSWTLRISGDGSSREELEELALTLGVSDRVHFLGFATGAELPERYRELDVIAVPSIPTRDWLEQFCRVAVEAMASGVPVVASHTGAIADVVEDAAILVRPSDHVDLASGISRALRPEQWIRMRKHGLAHVQRFSWESVAEQHAEHYATVLPCRNSGAQRLPQVVVVAFGSPDILSQSLSALDRAFPVTVVDNGSSKATRAIALEHGAHYIDPGANVGFAAGVNAALRSLGARGSSGDDVLLLNPDAQISPASVITMHELLHADNVRGAVGATQRDPRSGVEARVWWPFPNPLRAWLEAFGLGRWNTSRGFVIGSVLLLRAEAIADVGPFDERFFLYAEETDWQKRAVDRGWRIDVARVDALHLGGGTSSDPSHRDRLFHASLETYQRKHFGTVGWQVFRTAMVLGAGIRSVTHSRAGRRSAFARLILYMRGPLASLKT
ncbi:Glycosyltransferase involved in cell wall bisynthesis [Paramicrobacterium humi]|uniref:D-inositol 3-phosphate glycosyltransferase n=2 Tax=Paramicrobacterium humi TaxID=640635 RepID=A0A1H4MLY0_9MICO|nr:Glycosyltransferase involved in cell wall bisynthesis [Microbacterium humi]